MGMLIFFMQLPSCLELEPITLVVQMASASYTLPSG
jgi:hypothetical protein